jgi:CRISPR/Cas system-associated exonuclease Cas4 (RecB family)
MKKQYTIKQRGLFKPDADKPFKVSRSQIESFVECPRCFYLNHRLGIRRPSSPPFNINMLVDRMLKKEFDGYRLAGTSHPLMLQHGLDAVPFQHPSIDDWRNNFRGMTWLDPRTNLEITGAVDDIWQHRHDGKLIVVDYKATAKDGEITLDDDWKVSYKRQMEVYTWLLRKQGLAVDDRGFFLYANGADADTFDGKIGFSISLLPYSGNTDWIEPTLLDIKTCLMAPSAPAAPYDCEFCGYIAASQGFPAGSTRKPTKLRRAKVGSNRHPADEMADVRERIAEFQEREAELREILIAATEAERVGEEWIALFSEQHRKLLCREALTDHFGAEALQPFMRESVATVLKLKDAHTGRPRRRRCNSGNRPQRTNAPDRPQRATSPSPN